VQCPRRRDAAGYVTAEAAVVLPVIALFALALLWMISLGIAQVRAVDCARDAARSLARGDASARAVAVGMRQAPPGTVVTVAREDGEVTARVTIRAHPPRWLLVPLPAIALHASASTPDEADPGHG
jgi:hypothetical protein